MALLKNGIDDVNTGDAASIALAKDDVLDLIDRTNAQLTINGIYVKLPQDEFWVGSSWSGDLGAAFAFNMPPDTPTSVLGFWYPEGGGGMIGNDNIVIPSSGQNPRLAHEFINFMLDKENSYKNFVNYNGYQTPLDSIKPSAVVPDVFPENMAETVVRPKYFDDGHFLLALTPSANSLWTAAWDEIKAGG